MTGPATYGRVAVLGGGVMGEAIVAAVLRAGVAIDDLAVSERFATRANELGERYGVRAADGNAKVAASADVVVIALKPNDVAGALAEISPALRPGAIVVSVAAGLPISFYETRLPAGVPVVRVMPNTPAVIGEGAAAISGGTSATPEHLDRVQALLAGTGLVIQVAEHDLDAVTAISGSGPAYVFYLVDALAEAGVLLGLTRAQALQLATATFRGSALLLAASGEHPVVLRERVSSPGGTTVAALRELDAHGVRAAVLAAAEAARDRSRELAAELDG
ncbi:pyrroline-5-carboxylate reductase [Cellulomonas sp. KRMCY2]|uniref:pyrroline-5-carboxylate reductase n=1 Tax=Cellulomonas sp. KRMCY2 TaxID=1304865 RepID=UPI00045E9AA2|nr:pyrroline-5-carboxylate reductase [Cellulomonas sp. KRMCY2]